MQYSFLQTILFSGTIHNDPWTRRYTQIILHLTNRLRKFLEGGGEVTNEDMGALNGDDVEGVDQLQGAAALVPTSSSTAAAVRLFKFNASLSFDQKLYVCSLSVNMRLH